MASSATATNLSSVRPLDSARILYLGLQVARAGLVLCLLFIGLAKFTPEEAQGIQPLVSQSPFMSWMYSLWTVQAVSNIIGTTELITAALLVAGIWSSQASLLGALACVATFLTTLSFLFSTPGAIMWGHGFPALGGTGQFLVKDFVLLGAAVALAAEALRRLRPRASIL
jgi:reactive chlorine resistance protein C